MKKELYRYDIFPKVFLAHREVTLTLSAIDSAYAFVPGQSYNVKLARYKQGSESIYPEHKAFVKKNVTADEQGRLLIPYRVEEEGEVYLRVKLHDEPTEKNLCVMNVYALEEDMAGRIPQRGDLHVHTKRSDGTESPETVCANYRGHGYDFMTVSDHRRYYPSMEAKKAFEAISDLNIVIGEEVHLPYNDLHFVNFGGSYSINALVTPNKNQEKAGDDLAWRSMDGKAPEPMTEDEFKAMIDEKAKEVDRPHLSQRRSFAVMEWIQHHVKEGHGLGIFPHPFWRYPMQQVPDDYLNYVYEKQPFDAFEVLGGETYYQHNGFQTGYYYQKKAEGFDPPIVGSTDTHGSTEHNKGALICSTIVFAKENTREGLIEAIKDKYSLAVDTISTEYRLVGDFRLVRYAAFLMEEYFPLHDLACQCEGYYMNQAIHSPETALPVLKAMKGQIPAMQKKYFAV